jgi:acetylornithine deacetylase/succinyl-diaminopimelate desuccinylase-like protein
MEVTSMVAPDTFPEDRRSQSLGELSELLRIPSISSLPEYASDVQRAAQWTADRLKVAGIEHVEIVPTGGHPVVYGDWLHAPGKPTVLIYGHFDVQPVDPIDLWTTPPFEPQERDARIYARGASDMKANLLMTILSVEVLLQADRLPVNVKYFLEGQEEIGSPQLPSFIEHQRERLTCDVVISADGTQWSEDQPSLLVGLKGGCGLQIDVHGAKSDLHSGIYGGAVANPIHALVRILDSMRSPDGTIQVEGFFDQVVPLTDEDHQAIGEVPFDEAAYRAEIGVDDVFGEPGYTTLERAWARPTFEVNGIWGGFQGEGVKTVLPSVAHAKITCRLVPQQDPTAIVDAVTRHIHRNKPQGVRVDVTPLPFIARPYLIARDHWANAIADEVLTEVYGKHPYYTRLGGSVPVAELFLSLLNAYTVSFGFGLSDENIHAPNEFIRLSGFQRGQRAWVKLLEQLGNHSTT